MLQFLDGSRRHIVTTFAVFLLVQEYNVIAQVITLLFLINSLIGTYLHQAFGKIVARFGERQVLVAEYAVLVLIFAAYALIPQAAFLNSRAFDVPEASIGGWVLFPSFPATTGLLVLLAIFVVDRILLGFSIAIESYMQKIALTPQEITGNVAVGQTINHIAAVIVPVAGGMMWETIGSQYTFLAGMAIVLVAVALATRIDICRQSATITAPGQAEASVSSVAAPGAP